MTAATPRALAEDLERAHRAGVAAASAGLCDPQLGSMRLAGQGVPELAEAAVTSATPFVRAPLLGRISAALALHPPHGDDDGCCPTCRAASPCATARALTG